MLAFIIFSLLIRIIEWIEYIIMGYIILGWFVFFGVIRSRENVFFRIYVFLMSKVEPLFGWIRQFLPTLGGWDFSPLVLFIVLHFLKVFLYKFFLLAIS